jgi:hypothetical protein
MIEVEGPDGTIYEVNTNDEAVARETVRKHLSKGAPAPAAVGQPSGLNRPRAFASGAADTATSGFYDEAVGTVAAARQIGREPAIKTGLGDLADGVVKGVRGLYALPEAAIRGVTGNDTDAMQQARERATQEVRQSQEALKGAYPGSYLAGQFTGGAAQAAIPMGKALEGARWGQRALQAGKTGAIIGGAYGVGSGEGVKDRAKRGVVGAGFGGLSGLALSPVADLVGASPALGAARQAVAQAPAAALNALRRATSPQNVNRGVGMTIGPPPITSMSGAGANRARPTGDNIAQRLARLADRNRMAPDELPNRIAQMRADPRGQVIAEAFDEPGVMSAATVARMPGQTGSLATEKMIERNAGQATRLGKDLTGQTEEAATDFLAQQVRAASQQHLTPVFAQPYSIEGRRAAVQAWDALAQRGSIKGALPAARNQIKELIQRGEAPTDALNDPAYLAHYAKMQLQRQIKDPTLIKTSAQQVDNGNLIAAAKELRAFVEQVRPGYAQAMEELQKVLIPRSIANLIENAPGVDPNIARRLRGNPEVRRALEKQFMEPFGQALKTEDQLYRNAQRMIPATGSQSTPLGLGAIDEMAMGGGSLPTSKQTAANWLMDRVAAPIQETRRNQYGQMLFTDVNALDPAQLQRIQDELRRITDLRAARSRGAASTGRATGAASSSQTNGRRE